MKKTKKIRKLLSSFICLATGTLSLAIVLSSCITNSNDDKNDSGSDDSIITPPNNDNNNGNNNSDNEKPIIPDTDPEVKPPIDNKPTEPNLPENNNPIKPPVGSELINSNSINLSQYGQLLPSQYLLNLNNLNDLTIDKTKIIENFDSTKVSEAKYSVLSLNDKNGSLSIKMEYKNITSNKLHSFIFNFNDLSKFENQNFNMHFDVQNKNTLNAKEISDKLANNDKEAKILFKYLEQNGAKLIFKNGIKELPLDYLNFEGGLAFNGFVPTWYTSNKDLKLKLKSKLLKINYYVKENNLNSITINNIYYPSNSLGGIRNPIELSCPSALDYLLEQITANNTYKEDKFASYYYYDILYNQHIESQLQLSNDRWLKNVKYDINGTTKKYRPVISKTIDPNIDNDGNLVIQIQMQLEDESVFSKKSKELTIESFQRISTDLFAYDNDKNNKFNLFCESSNQDNILNRIKSKENFSIIKNKIDTSNNEIVDLSSYFNTLDHANFINFIKLYFGNSEIIENNGFFSSIDKKISIKKYLISYYDSKNVIIQYNKLTNCFQTKCIITIESKGVDNELSTSEAIIVNLTKINKPLS